MMKEYEEIDNLAPEGASSRCLQPPNAYIMLISHYAYEASSPVLQPGMPAHAAAV